jgi:hypothetical protein
MSRFTLKTAALLLLSAGAACAHAPDAVHPATGMTNGAPVTVNAAAYPFAINGAKSFTGGRFVANAIPRAVPANETDSLVNIPAGM